jgi:hypothetical protein
VQRVEIKDIAPPPELVAAMARQMKAERDKRANVLEAEGFKQAAVLKAEGEKQAVILAAEGRREAAFRAAEARERQAEAEARAVSEAIGRDSIQAINYFVAQRYIDTIGRLAGTPNEKVILMLLESALMIGSLAGIAEVPTLALHPTQRRAIEESIFGGIGGPCPMEFWHWLVVAAAFAIIEVAASAMVCISPPRHSVPPQWPGSFPAFPGSSKRCGICDCERCDRPDSFHPRSTAAQRGPSRSSCADLYIGRTFTRPADRRRAGAAQSRRYGLARRRTRIFQPGRVYG